MDVLNKRNSLPERLSTVYGVATTIAAAIGIFWFIALLAIGQMQLALIEGVMTIVSVLTWLLIRSGRLSIALVLAQFIFYVVLMIISLVYDVPNDAAPRVTHLFMLVLALLGYINYIRQPSLAQLAMIGVALLSFLFFASTNFVPSFAQPLPDAMRVPGSWINSATALIIICGCVYIMQAELARRSVMVRELQAALFGNQMELFYQPQVDNTGKTIGAEALLRWKHPKRGYVSPVEFIPVAEQNGLMTLIGGWVLEQACLTLVEWQKDPAKRDLRLAVNVSANQFLDPGFEAYVLALTERLGIDRRCLKLELTESVMVASIDLVAGKMTTLHEAGIGTALDDFGTGYSSLGYLKRLPLEQLKIDRSFVQDVLDNERSASLARSVIQIGHDMGLTVLAEGVETEAQFRFLRDAGCGEFQGYFFGRPVPLSGFSLAPALPSA